MANSQAHYASASLYVGDLHKDVTEAILYEVFNSVGPVASIRVCRDSSSRRSLGYAYVNYHSVGDAERSLDTLNYTHIKNLPCRLMWSHRDPSLRKSGAGNIFVKNLDKDIDNKALYDTFSLFGNILSCKVAQDDFGKSLGYGFVHYETEAAAETAILRVNNMKIGSKMVYVGPFKKRSDRESSINDKFTNLYVKHIPADWDEEKLQEVFGAFGEVTSIAVRKDALGRCFGYVNYGDAEGAKLAIAGLHDKRVVEPSQKANKGDREESNPGEKQEDEKEGGAEGKSPSAAAEVASEETDFLYVSRFQSRAERNSMLRNQFDQTSEQRQKKQGLNLYIKNVHDSVDDVGLRELFEPFGTVTSVKVMRDEHGHSRGFGFVSYLTPDEATKAVTEMHLKLVEGKPLYVGLHEPREERMQRLQQKYRWPAQLHQRMPTNNAPSQIQFGAPPSMYFGPGMQQTGTAPIAYQTGGMNHRSGGSWLRGQHNVRGYHHAAGASGANGGMTGYGLGAHTQLPAGPTGGTVPMTAAHQKLRYPAHAAPPVSTPGGGVRGRELNESLWMAAASGAMPATTGGGGAAQHHIQHAASSGGVGFAPSAVQDLPLSSDMLAEAPSRIQKQVLGERLFPLIQRLQPTLAGKITGMMLDMDNSELLMLLESESQLRHKVDEALRVLHQAQAPSAGAAMSGSPELVEATEE